LFVEADDFQSRVNDHVKKKKPFGMVFDHIKGGGADKLQVASYNRLRWQVAQMHKTHSRKP